MVHSMGHLFLCMTACLSIVTAASNGTHDSTTTACQQLQGDLANVTYVPSQSQYLPLSVENWYEFPVAFFSIVLD